MNSFGYFSCIWFGWILGFIQLRAPWGSPSFKSWKSKIFLWSVVVLIVQHVLFIDFGRQTKLVDALAVNLLTRKIHVAMFFIAYLAFWTVRLVCLIHAKSLANLLYAFYVYPIKKEYLHWRIAWRVVIFFICLSATFLISSAGVFILALRTKSQADSPSWFFVFGKVLSGMLAAFFGHLSFQASTNVAFSLVIYISFYLGMIYCDFCNDLLEFLQHGNRNVLFLKEFGINGDDNFKKTIFLHSPLSKEILLNKFEGIRDLFEEGNKIISPLALTVIVVETFRGVSGAHELLINKLGGFFALNNYLNVTQQLIHAGLVFAGQYVVDKMNERRKRLERIVALMEETDADKKCTVKLTKYVIDFNWKLSAFGFFYVDKKLLSGMMATAMTYIVILVQLQISLHSSCSTHSILSGINTTEIF